MIRRKIYNTNKREEKIIITIGEKARATMEEKKKEKEGKIKGEFF